MTGYVEPRKKYPEKYWYWYRIADIIEMNVRISVGWSKACTITEQAVRSR